MCGKCPDSRRRENFFDIFVKKLYFIVRIVLNKEFIE